MNHHGIRRVASIGAVALALSVSGAILAPSASAATTVRAKALNEAKAQKNDPYKYGAAGPSKFDCSGLTQYSYKKAGKNISRTAQGQYNSSKHVKSARVGDLVFFGRDTKHISHVGIYAGGGKIWNANTGSYRGKKVVLAPTKEYRYGGIHEYSGQVK